MPQLPFIRSNTFRWASAVAGVFAAFIVILFGFIYWRTDRYLIARSDRMITQQIEFVAALPFERRIDAANPGAGADACNNAGAASEGRGQGHRWDRSVARDHHRVAAPHGNREQSTRGRFR
jgi:hypothetical protein